MAATRVALTGAALLLTLLLAVPAAARPLPAQDRMELYTARATTAQVEELRRAGFDPIVRRLAGRRVVVDVVLAQRDLAKARSLGIRPQPRRTRAGRSSSELSARQAQSGFQVWRSFSEPGGIRDELFEIAREHPRIVELETVGQTHQGKPILALKVTKDARRTRDGRRPAVLYSALQHAREWITVEMSRRLLHRFVDGYGSDPRITRLVNTRELWFLVVANPDGYDFTFEPGNRLWRKNLRDNDGDGVITGSDGVDLNRNFATNWNYDEEGSSGDFTSETYRGPAPSSEPETQAMDRLHRRVGFEFQVNYHSYANLLLYPLGWQVSTETADNPIYEALSGDDAAPAVPTYDPDLSAELYTTNGETTDHVHGRYGTLAWTPEMGEGIAGSGFVFPDDEALIKEEFERNVPFALDVAESAARPDDPVSHLGNEAPDFEVNAFAVSYGDPQVVQVNAKRSLGKVRLRYRVGDGRVHTERTFEWRGGERYGDGYDRWYHRLRGVVRGADPGDSVTVWFEAKGRRSDSFTYTLASDTGNDVLVLAAEDYTGEKPAPYPGPRYLPYYLDSLAANGIPADVYDVDARGRVAPDPLGVLSHYDAVVWYTGDDVATSQDPHPLLASRLAQDEMLAARDRLNEGGRLLHTGSHAGEQFALGLFYNANGEPPTCLEEGADCLQLSNDFLQYYLGSYVYASGSGTDPDTGSPFAVGGIDEPFAGLGWTFGGADSAQNRDHTAAHLATSSFLAPETYPQFRSWDSADWLRDFASPFEPRTGDWYVWSDIADATYKRLTTTVDLSSAAAAELKFQTSYDTEPAFDALFVEAHTVGQDDWTTLPEASGHTSQTDTLESCAIEWNTIHPWLDRYQTIQPDGTCTPTGAGGGEWHAASGNSGGWQEWRVDLSRYAGKQVELSISYASDFSVQGIGAFVDDVGVTADGAPVAETSFEDGPGGWAASGPPEGSPVNPNDWTRSQRAFEEGAAVSTPDSVYFGFGLEGVSGAQSRAEVMGRAMGFLLRGR